METWQIILSILGVLGGQGVLSLVFFKVTKRMKEAEAKGKETDNAAKQNDQWQEIVEYLKGENADLKKENTEKNGKIEDMNAKINEMVIRVCKIENRLDNAETFRCNRIGCKERLQNPINKETTEVNNN